MEFVSCVKNAEKLKRKVLAEKRESGNHFSYCNFTKILLV